MNTQQAKKGFTIIEVVLVLAIAGLIFLMIFIAWPALQRSQRDTARKNDANVIASAVGNYRSNNRGSNPDITGLKTYLDGLSQYEVGDVGTIVPREGNFKNIYVGFGKKCDPANAGVPVAGSSRSAAVVLRLEGSNATDGTPFCQDA